MNSCCSCQLTWTKTKTGCSFAKVIFKRAVTVWCYFKCQLAPGKTCRNVIITSEISYLKLRCWTFTFINSIFSWLYLTEAHCLKLWWSNYRSRVRVADVISIQSRRIALMWPPMYCLYTQPRNEGLTFNPQYLSMPLYNQFVGVVSVLCTLVRW